MKANEWEDGKLEPDKRRQLAGNNRACRRRGRRSLDPIRRSKRKQHHYFGYCDYRSQKSDASATNGFTCGNQYIERVIRRRKMRKLTKQEIIDIIYGCTVLGTGGGGSLEGGLSIMEEDFKAGREFILSSLEEVPDEEMVACPYVCGSISPMTEAEEQEYAGLPEMDVTEAVRSFQILEEYFGKNY